MTNSTRLWRKRNAAKISAAMARRALIFREDGSVDRIQHHTALAIIERAFRCHMERDSRPTALRMTLDEASTFPLFEPLPSGVPVVWLVVVSDEDGYSAYGLAQEDIAAIDPGVRAAAARAKAQFFACYELIEDKLEAANAAALPRAIH